MTRFNFPREFHVPKGAVKICDKLSDAVAYLHDNRDGKPCAMVFFGKQSKPIANYRYRTADEREKAVTRCFEARRGHSARVDAYRKDRVAFKHSVQVGDIYRTSWGYDQTNVEFFEVTDVRGKHAILRELQQASEDTGWLTGKAVPQSGLYREKTEPIRRLIQDGRIKIDDVRTAWPWGEKVAGIIVGEAAHWSAYH